MFDLPVNTEVNNLIPQKTIFLRAVRKPAYRALYAEQVRELWWRNKLYEQNFSLGHIGAFSEIEVFEAKLKSGTVDKRLLREIDRAMPYYIIHVLESEEKYQILVADKRIHGGKIRIENYARSRWLGENELDLDFGERSIDKLYESLSSQVRTKAKKPHNSVVKEECDSFMDYFRKMAMTRSYKPVLIIAVLQSGGQITVSNAANYFKWFYADRQGRGLPIERGRCVYSDPDASDKDVETNLIKNPVNALCESGRDFFQYDPESQIFMLKPEIYDGLTVDEIDMIISTCRMRITEYFKRK